MGTDAKTPKSLTWFEPSWSFRPRLERDLDRVFDFRVWARILLVALLLVILLAFFVVRAVPNLQFDWTYAFIVAFGAIVLYLASITTFLWFVPPRVGISAKGVYRQEGSHAVWRRHSDIRRIVLDRTVLERPRLCVEAAGKKDLECGIASKIDLDLLAPFLVEMFPNSVIEERNHGAS